MTIARPCSASTGPASEYSSPPRISTIGRAATTRTIAMSAAEQQRDLGGAAQDVAEAAAVLLRGDRRDRQHDAGEQEGERADHLDDPRGRDEQADLAVVGQQRRHDRQQADVDHREDRGGRDRQRAQADVGPLVQVPARPRAVGPADHQRHDREAAARRSAPGWRGTRRAPRRPRWPAPRRRSTRMPCLMRSLSVTEAVAQVDDQREAERRLRGEQHRARAGERDAGEHRVVVAGEQAEAERDDACRASTGRAAGRGSRRGSAGARRPSAAARARASR